MSDGLEPLLWEAYRSTRFEVHMPEGVLCIRVGQLHPDLDAMMAVFGASCWCYVTASNPGSAILSDEMNGARYESLLQQLTAADYRVFDGWGRGEDPNWEPERSLLVLQIAREQSVLLGRQFAQNAVVWGQAGGIAELVDCRVIPTL
tara:strand:- start:20 stop:460 length:441 start_codon:yes stop_codon:yes gene_type:complete